MSEYVIVNTCFELLGGGHPVLGEIPSTYGSVEDAMEAVVSLQDEYGHTLETAKIYRLVEVPVDDELKELFEQQKREYYEE